MTADDDRFPDGTEVWVKYPATVAEKKGDREEWPWLAGVIVERCGTDEWAVQVTAREVATAEDGSPAPAATRDEDLWFPLCFREASGIRRQEEQALCFPIR